MDIVFCMPLLIIKMIFEITLKFKINIVIAN